MHWQDDWLENGTSIIDVTYGSASEIMPLSLCYFKSPSLALFNMLSSVLWQDCLKCLVCTDDVTVEKVMYESECGGFWVVYPIDLSRRVWLTGDRTNHDTDIMRPLLLFAILSDNQTVLTGCTFFGFKKSFAIVAGRCTNMILPKLKVMSLMFLKKETNMKTFPEFKLMDRLSYDPL